MTAPFPSYALHCTVQVSTFLSNRIPADFLNLSLCLPLHINHICYYTSNDVYGTNNGLSRIRNVTMSARVEIYLFPPLPISPSTYENNAHFSIVPLLGSIPPYNVSVTILARFVSSPVTPFSLM